MSPGEVVEFPPQATPAPPPSQMRLLGSILGLELSALTRRVGDGAALVSVFAVVGYAALHPGPWPFAAAALYTAFAWLWQRRT